jgi:hypothetical protein
MPVEFHGDETLLTSHETHILSVRHVSIFNAMKRPMKLHWDWPKDNPYNPQTDNACKLFNALHVA